MKIRIEMNGTKIEIDPSTNGIRVETEEPQPEPEAQPDPDCWCCIEKDSFVEEPDQVCDTPLPMKQQESSSELSDALREVHWPVKSAQRELSSPFGVLYWRLYDVAKRHGVPDRYIHPCDICFDWDEPCDRCKRGDF